MLKNASDEETMSKTEASEWFSKFKSGVTSVADITFAKFVSQQNTQKCGTH